MLLYTVCFTPKGKEPSSNKYVDMLFIWLRFLQRYGNVLATDTILVITDVETKKYIDSMYLDVVIPLTYRYCILEQPETVQIGTSFRYTIYTHTEISKETVVCYTDVDMLIIKDIHWIEQLVQADHSSFFVYPEHTIRHFNYLGPLSKEEEVLFEGFEELFAVHPGMSSSFFAFQGSAYDALFEQLGSTIKTSEKSNYAFDQPFFNRMLLLASYKQRQFQILFFQPFVVEYNTLRSKCKERTCLINMCGEPGEQNIHWIKMFMALLTDV